MLTLDATKCVWMLSAYMIIRCAFDIALFSQGSERSAVADFRSSGNQRNIDRTKSRKRCLLSPDRLCSDVSREMAGMSYVPVHLQLPSGSISWAISAKHQYIEPTITVKNVSHVFTTACVLRGRHTKISYHLRDVVSC